MIFLIAALSKQTRAIGKEGGLIWDIPTDMKRFRELTRDHPIIMGRKTWDSLPDGRRPLPHRTNIVITRDESFAPEGALVAHSIEDAIELAKDEEGSDQIWVIGGGQIYEAALPYADRLYLTEIDDPTDGDAHFPPYDDFNQVWSIESREENGIRYDFVVLARPPSTS